jgi:hypothetical protein
VVDNRGELVPDGNIHFMTLDWELDEVSNELTLGDLDGFDAVIACDCIYNEALIRPLVQTCSSACKLRNVRGESKPEPSLCIVAQQLRNPEVFELWLKEFHHYFRVWRLSDSAMADRIRPSDGFVVHVGILRTG